LREPGRHLFERTEVFGSGDIASVWEGLIYDNCYSSRLGSKLPPAEEEVRLGVPSAAADAWRRHPRLGSRLRRGQPRA
jgi:hypothetical protein